MESCVTRTGTRFPTVLPSITDVVFGRGLLYTVATVAPIISVLVFTPALTRTLDSFDYGVLAASLVAVQVIAMLIGLGLPAAITRAVIMRSQGVTAARGLLVNGSLMSLAVGVTLASTSPLWWSLVMPFGWRPAAIAVVVSGVGTAVATQAQAMYRGRDQVGRFVVTAVLLTVLGQGVGTAVAVTLHSANGYLWGQAGAYTSIAAVSLWRASAGTKRLRGELFPALRVGLPTVPHQVAFYMASGSLVLLTGHRLGVSEGGRLQLAMLVGTAPSLLVNAMNNAWAPSVYRADVAQRGLWLQRSSAAIAWFMVPLVACVALAAPAILRFVAPVSMLDRDLYTTSVVVATTGVLSVWYLSNVHLIFAEGRTGGLSWVSPTSLLVAVGTALLLSLTGSVILIAATFPLFFVVQGALTATLARRVSDIRWKQSVLVPPLLTALLITVPVTLLPASGAAVPIRLSASLALGLGSVCVLAMVWRSRREA